MPAPAPQTLTHAIARERGSGDLLTRPNENTSAAPPHPNHVTSSAQTPPTPERTNQNVRLHVILLHFLNINHVTAESAQPRYRARRVRGSGDEICVW